MFFRDLVASEDEWKRYEQQIAEFSCFVSDCVRYLIDAYKVAETNSAKDPCYSHATVLMLTRHIIESIDGVSVLSGRGCAENCGPLLRSAFEGQLGLLYILESDSKRRALAYQVAHVHRKIKAYRKCDPNDPLGKQFRAELKDDPMADIFDRIPVNLHARISNLENMLKRPEFSPIELEWQTLAKRKTPEWFALFGGPATVRALAIRLKLGSAYEGLYRGWSDVVHAGSGLNHVGPSEKPGTIVIRPIRHPDGLETACSLAAQMCLNTARKLIETYGREEWERFRQAYSEKIGPRYIQIAKGNLIHCPWRHGSSEEVTTTPCK
jgi:hypothetical protein